MNNPLPQPWAILLCRFSDDQNLPAQTTLSQLYQQWTAEYGTPWLSGSTLPQQASDSRTILELYQAFFTPAGAGTYNAVRYWDDMSHGAIDVSSSKVIECVLDITKEVGAALAQTPGGGEYQNLMFQKAKAALSEQHGIKWQDFYGVAVSFQSPDYGSQGGWYDGGPGVFMDIRYVMGNGMEAWGQEMGHAFGLDHSRVDGSDVDYQDPWDVMSTANAYSGADPNYGLRGPGLNAWNMRGRKWLDESRIWRHGAASPFSNSIVIRPLHRRDLSGYLGLELPGMSVDGRPFLLEFRTRAGWDIGIPESCVLVHRFEGPIEQFLGTHSYLMHATNDQRSLSVGDSFEFGGGLGPRTRAEVVDIDDVDQTAEITITYSTSLSKYRLRPIPKWEWSPEQILQNAHRFSNEELQRVAMQTREVSRTVAQILKQRGVS